MKVPLTLRDFLDRPVTVYPDRIAVVDEPDQPAPSWGELTFTQLDERARAQAAALDRLGVGPGDRPVERVEPELVEDLRVGERAGGELGVPERRGMDRGEDLTGGVPGQMAPLGPDLSVVKRWTYEQFAATLRTGTDPDGNKLGDVMPWRTVGRMQDDELRAIYAYLTQR